MISTAITPSAVARVTGIKTSFRQFRSSNTAILPQRVAVVGQGNSAATYDTTKIQLNSALEVANRFGFGSPLHLAALQLLPANGDGVGSIPVTFYPLAEDGAATAAAGNVTPTGTATAAGEFELIVSGQSIPFTVAVGDDAAAVAGKITTAINGALNAPITATTNVAVTDVTAKWAGASGNDITMFIIGPNDTGVTFAITEPTGGATNPDVQPALDQIGDVWETLLVNCLEPADTTALAAYETFGVGRWGALTHKPLVVVTGSFETDVNTAITTPEANKAYFSNAFIIAPDCANLPLEIAAAAVCRMALLADVNPAHDYGGQSLPYLYAGTDANQWDYADRDQAVKGGVSTTQVKDGVVTMSDTVTFYHPTGDINPAYRYVVDIVKLQNVIFNISLEFNSAEWDGAPLIDDNQPTTNRSAKKPKMAVAAAAAIVEELGLLAILTDVRTTKQLIEAGINQTNAKRLDLKIPVKLSGNTNIKSIDLDFGFNFGIATVVA